MVSAPRGRQSLPEGEALVPFRQGRGLLQQRHLHLGDVRVVGVAARLLAVVDELTVDINLKAALSRRRQGDCEVGAELAVELCPYPRGLSVVPSDGAVDDLQVCLACRDHASLLPGGCLETSGRFYTSSSRCWRKKSAITSDVLSISASVWAAEMKPRGRPTTKMPLLSSVFLRAMPLGLALL